MVLLLAEIFALAAAPPARGDDTKTPSGTAPKEAPPSEAPTGEAPTAEAPMPQFLGIVINGQAGNEVTMVLRLGDRLFIAGDDLDRWRLQRPARPDFTSNGKAYYGLGSLDGVRAAIDEQQQVLRLTIPLDRFRQTNLTANEQTSNAPMGGVMGAFLNYDLVAERNDDATNLSGFFETGVSDDWGLLSTTALAQNDGEGHDFVRLDSAYVYDDPQDLRRLTVGDAVTRGAEWSSPIRFGGVQYGSDFGLQPNFISFPTPGFTGQTTLPSTVEVYVNDALRYQHDLEQGPFSVNQVPVVTGAGDLRFVVKDALGVERSFTTPYYISANLLRDGLDDYSIEGGFERDRYGIDSFDYGQPFVSGNYRYGLSDRLTAEGHAEASPQVQMAGGGLSWVWPSIGEFGAFAAASNGDNRGGGGNGALGRVSFSRNDRWWSLSLSYQQATDEFTQLGWDDKEERILRQVQAAAGLSFGDYGSLSLSYTQLKFGDNTKAQVSSASYSIPVFDIAYLNAYALFSDTNESASSTTFGTMITIPLGGRRSATVTAESRDGRFNGMAEFRQDRPSDSGLGYRLAVSQGDVDREEGELSWRADFGDFTAQASNSDDTTAVRLLASGGIGHADGTTFFSRRIENGFGIVTVPGYDNITVYQDNRPRVKTDSDGVAVIPDLRAYEQNQISISPTDLPLDSTVDNDHLKLVPRFRGAVAARFAVASVKSATVIVTLPDGSPLPAGVTVTIAGHRAPAYSGYRGEVFVTDIKGGEQAQATWNGGACHFTIGDLPPNQALPRLGPVTCQPD